ncbi:Dam family site-specific DNA-(adenine-N6)-methyltransferase [Carnobacterium maltaromaticum]|uniref:Dam family site-specific DNA-(adenine-N6)-methyltransferase n=1 Tax=Carnobacterium maltaromaticum TaxID=2751 RepID=UPI001C55FA99
MTQKDKIIQSAFNYTGGKFKLIPQLLPLFPTAYSYGNFIDLFTGGGTVGVNAKPTNTVYMNDLENHVVEVFELFSSIKYDNLLVNLQGIIEKYRLSNTKMNGYEFYGVNSTVGLGGYNKPFFLKLRADYNSGVFKGNEKVLVFYLLTVFGFNNQIRFNSKKEYNLPVGKRDFNNNMEKKLYTFHKTLHEGNFNFSSKDFREFSDVKAGDFVYADPPYRITTASYNENGGWGIQDDVDLFSYLDEIHNKGAKFALSNVVIHNGQENEYLVQWAGKYNLNILDHNYNNSNYQSKAKISSTVEVLITNY